MLEIKSTFSGSSKRKKSLWSRCLWSYTFSGAIT